jgi:hypothetical protein
MTGEDLEKHVIVQGWNVFSRLVRIGKGRV